MKTPIKDDKHNCHVTPADGAIHRDGSLVAVEFVEKKTAHWERYGNGQQRVHLLGNTGAGWLSIDTTESGTKSAKRTMATLQRADVERLRDLCDLVLGEVLR